MQNQRHHRLPRLVEVVREYQARGNVGGGGDQWRVGKRQAVLAVFVRRMACATRDGSVTLGDVLHESVLDDLVCVSEQRRDPEIENESHQPSHFGEWVNSASGDSCR